MEQNYVTVTLCVLTGCILSSSIVGLLKKPALLTSLTLWTLDSSMSEPQQQERHRSFFYCGYFLLLVIGLFDRQHY